MKTYVIVGTGGRALMFMDIFTNVFKNSVKLLAICDNNAGRLKLAAKRIKKDCPDLVSYPAEDFDKMISEHKPDCVIVTTKDSEHAGYICRALKAGCDAVSEKPMTTDEKRCQKIIDAVNQTGKSVRVTFNYRYSPPRSQVKELLMTGVIGKILSVSFQWNLDTNHGADYFRRWHRNKANSGGLLVHKATHHFDLVNWWLSSTPQTVFAKGKRVFYNAQQADRYGLQNRSERCLDCPASGKCNYYLDMKSYPVMKELYLDNEEYDGYFRDRCVFSDKIDIEDSVGIIAEYKSGAILTYALNAFASYESYRIEFNGTKGRLEHSCQESSYVSGDGSVQGASKGDDISIRVFPHFKAPYSVPPRSAEGSHGGGDIEMANDIFGSPEPDPLLRSADHIQGAYSILVGIAANKSMEYKRPIRIDELVTGLGDPGFPEMSAHDDNIPYAKDFEYWIAGQKRDAAGIPERLIESEKNDQM